MAVRFRKRIKIAPGVKLNLSSNGASVSLGGRGASLTIGKKGTYSNLSLPGSGLSYRTKLSSEKNVKQKQTTQKAISDHISVKVRINEDGSVEYLNPIDDTHLPENIVTSIKKNNKETLISLFKQACKKNNDGLDLLDKLHLTVMPPSDTRIYHEKDYPEPRPKKAKLKEKTFLSKIFPFIEKNRVKFNESIELAYNKKLKNWSQKKEEFDKNERDIAYRINELLASGNEEVINSELVTLLSNISFPKETNVDFEINEDNLVLDVDLPEIEDIPNKKYTASDNSLRISVKTISDTERRKIYMTHIHSIIFRIIADVFSLIPTIKRITLSAYSQRPNNQNGNIEDQYLVSVNINKEEWKSINFNNIEHVDVVECFNQFDLIRDMSKTGVFKAIIPFATIIKDNDAEEQEEVSELKYPNEDNSLSTQESKKKENKLQHQSLSILLIIGIIFLPCIFSWFTLKTGYSKKARIISFSWMFLSIIAYCS
ncbi:DUF4236 domain-containing protein [Gilliamella sp. ESL0250]|uniref:DUF4236 domain-containing protein n=1 Tax=Gilliamella sp. ESL0250 TaxID=2705036 RepID=UPI00157FD92C|nr:DUF4236 domain-containing protein [Gilliamella sp. ESL0250]NUF49488.1 DUF4236 domain-containing protein [Gilliamella sp. ESL0250]